MRRILQLRRSVAAGLCWGDTVGETGFVEILGLRVHKVDMAEAVRRVRDMLVADDRAHQVVTLNSEMAMRAQCDRDLAFIINDADLVVPDGAGVVWASRVLGTPLPARVAGFDLMQELIACAGAEGWPVFLLGAAPGVADEAAARLTVRVPGLRIAGIHHGFFGDRDEQGIVEKINASGARLVFVAMGAPRQDRWIARNRARLRPSVCIGVGGSLDVLAGRVSRAPKWMGEMGFEWLYRLVREPRRFVRMLALPKFMLRVFAEKFSRRNL
ncbi:MAG: N-acetylglucosaminyldiphosphoundecaprenol N-acetyl-beta-D-mannosaminyltransferase [Bacillota bacterium]|nr:N-acetylglucosaminyldiphosphoundecaprenol N-acetyl-beta-D-mannosaminyltransferase [Bacillota bacterium]